MNDNDEEVFDMLKQYIIDKANDISSEMLDSLIDNPEDTVLQNTYNMLNEILDRCNGGTGVLTDWSTLIELIEINE